MEATTTTRPDGLLARTADRMARSDLSAKLHARAFRASRGRLGASVQGRRVLLLTTVGRRSGRRRAVTLVFVRDGDRYLVVPSNASHPDRSPAWWHNLRAEPRARVLVGGRWQDVRAVALSGADRDAWWPTLANHNPHWRQAQEQTTRQFPVVALVPVTARVAS